MTDTSSRRYPDRPIVGVGAVVCAADGRVVLVKRRFEPLAGRWSVPGGAIELGETLQQGVAREVREETGLLVDVGPVVHVFDRIVHDREARVEYHYVLVDFVCWPTGGRLMPGTDAVDAVLADPNALDEFGLHHETRSVIERASRVARPST